jgi:hypothetical protein
MNRESAITISSPGTYDVSVQLKASSGSVSAKERRLDVLVAWHVVDEDSAADAAAADHGEPAG